VRKERLLLQAPDGREAPTRGSPAAKEKRMFYRIVLQGQVQQGVALDDVKRQFSYVTGLPPSVTDRLFGAAPTVIKRQVAETDAERISATLRAIGAIVTVEPLLHVPRPVGPDPVTVPGLPTAAEFEVPKARPPEQDSRPPPRQRHRRVHPAAVAALTVAVAMVAAHQYEEHLRAARRSPPRPVSAQRPAEAPEVATEAPVFRSAHIVGPWRCTDQNTGASTYWEYAEDGVLSYFGDDRNHGDKPIAHSGHPSGWALSGNRLTFRHEAAPARSVTLGRLSFIELEYRDAKGDEVRCRRP
jgi:hypothetical protein